MINDKKLRGDRKAVPFLQQWYRACTKKHHTFFVFLERLKKKEEKDIIACNTFSNNKSR